MNTATASDRDRMLDAMAAEVRTFAAEFHDDPAALSDWGHKYFCPADGGHLHWDAHSPVAHVCVVCEKIYTGAPYDRAWTTFYRNEAFQTVRKAAVLWSHRGEPDSLAALQKILGFYADHYHEFPWHSRDTLVDTPTPNGSGAGKIMPQGLNEAIILVRAVQALELTRDALEPAFVEKISAKLLVPAAEFLAPQANRVHNIPTWVDAAVGTIGLFLGRQDWIAQALDDPAAGVQVQLKEGLTEDSLWYEGSIHYHYFTLEAALSLLVPAARQGLRRPRAEEAVRAGLEAGWRFAFSSGRFPAPNDGWPDVGLKTYIHVYDLGEALFGSDSAVAAIRRALVEDPSPRTDVPLSRPYYFEDRLTLERLIVGLPCQDKTLPVDRYPALKRGSYVLRGSCFALLRSPGLEVFVKYGHNGPSHAHPDKMNLEVALGEQFLTRDLSNAGYGSPLCDQWHRSSPAHNTVVVDGQDHQSTERGRVLWFDRDQVAVRAADVYPGVDFARTLSLSHGGFADLFEVKSEESHTYDWFFHVDGDLDQDLPGVPASLEMGGAYQLLEQVRELPRAAEYEFRFRVAGHQARFQAAGEGLKAYLCRSLDNPVSGRRWAIVLRAQGVLARFSTEWTLGGLH